MNLQSALKSQYHAALQTLQLCVQQCPDEFWDKVSDGGAPFWRTAYHTLYFTHLYLQKNARSFKPWAKHRKGANNLGSPTRKPPPCAPYTRKEILEYWRWVDRAVDSTIEAMDLSATKCGFWWYPLSKLEHQLVNIRHIQHHAAILSHRVRAATGVRIKWVGHA